MLAAAPETPHRSTVHVGAGRAHASPRTSAAAAAAAAAAPTGRTPLRLADSHMLELRRQLREAQHALQERERDLQLAVEIGQSLLQSNEQLKLEYERILAQQASPASASVLAERLRDLEMAHLDLQSRHDAAVAEAKRAAESERNARAWSRRIEANNDELSRAMQELSEQLDAAETDRRRLARERQDAHSRLQALEAEQDGGSSHLAVLADELERARAQIEAMAAGWHEMEALRDRHAAEAEDLLARCGELEAMLEAARAFRDEAEAEAHRADQLAMELEEERERLAAAMARLAVFEPTLETAEQDAGSRTLLSEVEDRRQALARQHSSLARKHVSLMAAHKTSLFQQERMRMHISRLSQLTQRQSSESRIQMLEQELAQSRSERRELERRAARLERMLMEARSGGIDGLGLGLAFGLGLGFSDPVEDYDDDEDDVDDDDDDDDNAAGANAASSRHRRSALFRASARAGQGGGAGARGGGGGGGGSGGGPGVGRYSRYSVGSSISIGDRDGRRPWGAGDAGGFYDELDIDAAASGAQRLSTSPAAADEGFPDPAASSEAAEPAVAKALRKRRSSAVSRREAAGLREVAEALRLRVEQGEAETATLRRELQTMQLLKGAESDKAAKLRTDLAVQTTENERLRAACAQLAFELDEMRFRQRQADESGAGSLQRSQTPRPTTPRPTTPRPGPPRPTTPKPAAGEPMLSPKAAAQASHHPRTEMPYESTSSPRSTEAWPESPPPQPSSLASPERASVDAPASAEALAVAPAPAQAPCEAPASVTAVRKKQVRREQVQECTHQ
ncbi:hypothetical protein HK105_200029 [Polyrhizophydium stewartii]|uniref:Uncharacterized protein n=1 Tax=Polyrhizophydium stewartii TaxID=2732419 RepID=A0ABR4NKA6_9FUNG